MSAVGPRGHAGATTSSHALVALALALSALAPSAGAQRRPADTDAIALVKLGVQVIRKDGAAKAYARINDHDGPFASRDLYLVVTSMDGVVLASGANARIVGKNLLDLKDIDGKPFVRERVELARTQPSFWQQYQYIRPTTGRIEPKRAYCERLRESVVCSGVYD